MDSNNNVVEVAISCNHENGTANVNVLIPSTASFIEICKIDTITEGCNWKSALRWIQAAVEYEISIECPDILVMG